jgi:hypothetical protein
MLEVAGIIKPDDIEIAAAADIACGAVCETLETVCSPDGKEILGYVRTGRLYQRCPEEIDDEVPSDMGAFFDLSRGLHFVVTLPGPTSVTPETDVVGHRLAVRVLSGPGVTSEEVRDAVRKVLEATFCVGSNAYTHVTGELKVHVAVAEEE